MIITQFGKLELCNQKHVHLLLCEILRSLGSEKCLPILELPIEFASKYIDSQGSVEHFEVTKILESICDVQGNITIRVFKYLFPFENRGSTPILFHSTLEGGGSG